LSGKIAADEFFGLGNQLLLIIISALLRFPTFLTLNEIIGIVARIA